MYQALYRKYRPQTFDDVVGQQVIIKTLSNSIINNKINHAYLFTGPRGTGKTSIAKIFAKIVNCENLNGIVPCNKCVNCTQINQKQNTDIIEIDAASNNGVDEIRELRDKVSLVPSFGKYKVYIIDEVHMLTTAAFNALLKTLEEPPKHIIFILATTEPHKIPLTILSRCQRYDFKKISINDITKRIKYVCNQENIDIDDQAIELIARLSDGGMRDSLSLLDQLTAYTSKKITINDVHDIYGTITDDEIYNLLINIFEKKLKEAFDLIEQFDETGKNLIKILENIIYFLKNVLIYYNCKNYFDDISQKYFSKILSLSDEENIYDIIEILLDTINLSKNTNNVKLMFELAIIKIIELKSKKVVVSESYTPLKENDINNKNIDKIAKKCISDEIKNKVNKLKEIRINNTLALFSKKELLEFNSKFYSIKEYLTDNKYSSIASLLLDGEVKAKGDKNLLFVYKLKNLEECFNTSLKEIEELLKLCFNFEYKPIAVFYDEWEIIKLDYNKSKKEKNDKYKYIEENIELNDNSDYTSSISSSNEIENIFNDLVIYN